MFRLHDWAVGSYSSGPPTAGTVGTKSTGGFYRADGSPCIFFQGGATRWGGSWRTTGATAVIRSHHNAEVYMKNLDKDKHGTGAQDWTRILSIQADNVISAAALIDKRVLQGIKYEVEPIAL